MEYIKNIYGKNKARGAHPIHEGGGRPLGAPPYLVGPCCSTDVYPDSIYSLSGRKKSRRRNYRVLRYRAAAKP